MEWELPTQWLWDIVDEFIYQFRLFCQLRSFGQHRAKLGDDVIALLRDSPSTWNVHIVLNVLHKLIEKSNINDQLEASNKGEDPNEVAGDFGCRTMYKMLGYFSIVGLLRLHTMLGGVGVPRYFSLHLLVSIHFSSCLCLSLSFSVSVSFCLFAVLYIFFLLCPLNKHRSKQYTLQSSWSALKTRLRECPPGYRLNYCGHGVFFGYACISRLVRAFSP